MHTPSSNKIPKDKNTQEVEAESVAYTVLKYYGYDTSDYSFGYIADWSKSKELNEFKESLDTIVKTSSFVINKLDAIFTQ